MAAILLGLFVVFFSPVSDAAQANRPSPSNFSSRVGKNVTLRWSWNEPNLLENGGFEQGTNGWILPPNSKLTTGTNGIAEGTNALRVVFGSVARELTVPNAPEGITFSFNASNTYFELLSLQLRDADNRILKTEPFWADGNSAFHYLDVTPFAGQTVKFILNVSYFDAVQQALDDFRITTPPQNLTFDVYFGPTMTPVFVGSTNAPSWPLKNLLPNRYYFWRIDAIEGGVTNTGPVWSFNTTSDHLVTHYDFAPMADAICPDTPAPVFVGPVDNQSFRSSATLPKMFAAADHAQAPSIVISEVDTGANDGVEFINVSTNTIDVRGWRVQLFDLSDTIPAQNIVLPETAQVAPGGIFTFRENETPSAWPNLRTTSILRWGDSLTAPLKAGVILRDAASNVVDCVFIDQSRPDDPSKGQSALVSIIDWRPPTIIDVETNKTYQRRGNADHNNSEDWILASSTMKSLNASMQIPFDLGFGKIDATFGQVTNISSTSLTSYVAGTSAQFSAPVTNARVVAANGTLKIWGMSDPFNVVPPGSCITLTGPDKVTEGSGVKVGALRVQLSLPASQDVAIHLRASDPRLQVASTVIIPTGASEVFADLNLGENDTLEGAQLATIVAESPGYSSSFLTLSIADNEKATLRFVTATTIVEGQAAPIVIESSLAPIVDVPIYVKVQGFWFDDQIAILRAFQTNTSIYLGTYNDLVLQPVPEVHLTASFEDWTPASMDITYVDDESPLIRIEGQLTGIEGQTVTGTIQLGGWVSADFPITLTSSDPDSLSVPSTVTVSTGQSGVTFPMTINDNPNPTSRRTVQISASGPPLIGTNVTFTIEDNDASKFVFEAPPGPWPVGSAMQIKLRALTVDGTPVPAPQPANGTFSASEIGSNAVLPVTVAQPLSADFGDGMIAQISINQLSTNALVRYDQSGLSGLLAVPVWTTVPTNIVQAIYSSALDLFVVRDTNSIWAIDGATGAPKSFEPAVENPSDILLSADGRRVYAIGNQGQRIHRIDLPSLQSISWAVDPAGVNVARNIGLLPGVTDGLIVVRQGIRFDVSKYEGSTQLASAVYYHYLANTNVQLTAGVSADNSYIYVGGDGAMVTYRSPSKNELFAPDYSGGLYRAGFFETSRPAYGDNLFALPSGVIADPLSGGEYSGDNVNFEVTGATAFDPATHRFARLAQIGADEPELLIYEPITFRVLGRQPVHYKKTGVWSLSPAGERGWAAIIGGDFKIIPNPAITLPPEANLAVSAAVVPYPNALRVLRAFVTVTNLGPNVASDTILAIAATDGVVPMYNAIVLVNPLSAAPDSSLRHAYSIGDLQPNEARTITIDLTGFDPLLRVDFFAGSHAPELDYSDNRAYVSQPLNLDFQSFPQQIALVNADPTNLEFMVYDQPGWGFVVQQSFAVEGPWQDVSTNRVTVSGMRFGGVPASGGPTTYYRLKRVP